MLIPQPEAVLRRLRDLGQQGQAENFFFIPTAERLSKRDIVLKGCLAVASAFLVDDRTEGKIRDNWRNRIVAGLSFFHRHQALLEGDVKPVESFVGVGILKTKHCEFDFTDHVTGRSCVRCRAVLRQKV